MTIVLQNQFWDLKVADIGFEVGLSFDDRPELLFIPFAAILGFFDPSVEFGLKFEVEADAAIDEEAGARPSRSPTPPARPSRATRSSASIPSARSEAVRKRSFSIEGHRTSLALEPEFWQALEDMAAERRLSLSALIAAIDAERPGRNLASSCRLAVLAWLRNPGGSQA